MCKPVLLHPGAFQVPRGRGFSKSDLACHWTIWGISLQALAFFLASAIQGGSSWARVVGGRFRWEGGVCPGSPGALRTGFSEAVLDGNGEQVSGVLEGDDGVAGDFGASGVDRHR